MWVCAAALLITACSLLLLLILKSFLVTALVFEAVYTFGGDLFHGDLSTFVLSGKVLSRGRGNRFAIGESPSAYPDPSDLAKVGRARSDYGAPVG